MSTLITWVGVDSRGPSSLHMASDSQFSWDSKTSWLHGKKIFTFQNHADLLGYCGDVFFTSHTLAQLTEIIDGNCVFPQSAVPAKKFEAISKHIKESFNTYPLNQKRDFNIIHGSRLHEGMSSKFQVFELSWSRHKGWTEKEHQIPTSSGLILAIGSGGASAMKIISKWSKSDVGGTSRAIYSGFAEGLANEQYPLSGGSPQLVSLYRVRNGNVIGTIHKNVSYVLGMPITPSIGMNNIEWRNDLFERCDGLTRQILPGAQKQPRPWK